MDGREQDQVLVKALQAQDPAIILDYIISVIIPLLPTRFRRDIWIRTIRRMIQLCEAKANQAGRMNRRHMEKNPTAHLPTHTTTITNQFSGLSVKEAIERNNQVLALLAAWALKRFGRLGFSTAFDEIDLPCFVKPTDRDGNDLWDYVIGGKDGEDCFRLYVTVITFPQLSVKLPLRFDLASYVDLDTGGKKPDLEVGMFVTRSLDAIKGLPRLPSHHHVDKGLFSWSNWAKFVAFNKYSVQHGHECRLVTPGTKTPYGTDDLHENPKLEDLTHIATRRALNEGPLSPKYIHLHAQDFARTKINEDHYAGFFKPGDPGAPNLLKGMVLVVERIRKPYSPVEAEETDLGQGWVGRITYVATSNPNILQLAEDARSYRNRNFIESAFWHFHWGFEEAGMHSMAGRMVLFGLALVVLSIHAMVRLWRGFYVRLGRFDYPLLDFLVDLNKTHTIPDEPG